MNKQIVSRILRVGLAFAFLYPAINGFFEPYNWIGYFPLYLQNLFPVTTMLIVFGIFEVVLALWLLSGWKIVYSSVLAALTLFAIVIFAWPQIDVLFRDLSIAAMAVALFYLEPVKIK